MLLNYKRIIIPVFIFLVVWGEKTPYKISETKAIIFAQLSFARDNFKTGKLPQVPIASNLFVTSNPAVIASSVI